MPAASAAPVAAAPVEEAPAEVPSHNLNPGQLIQNSRHLKSQSGSTEANGKFVD